MKIGALLPQDWFLSTSENKKCFLGNRKTQFVVWKTQTLNMLDIFYVPSARKASIIVSLWDCGNFPGNNFWQNNRENWRIKCVLLKESSKFVLRMGSGRKVQRTLSLSILKLLIALEDSSGIKNYLKHLKIEFVCFPNTMGEHFIDSSQNWILVQISKVDVFRIIYGCHFKNHCPQKTTNTFTPPKKKWPFFLGG